MPKIKTFREKLLKKIHLKMRFSKKSSEKMGNFRKGAKKQEF